MENKNNYRDKKRAVGRGESRPERLDERGEEQASILCIDELLVKAYVVR